MSLVEDYYISCFQHILNADILENDISLYRLILLLLFDALCYLIVFLEESRLLINSSNCTMARLEARLEAV